MSLQPVVAVLLIAPILLLVPGYFTVAAFAGLRKKGNLDWTFPEAFFTIVATSVFVVSWFALLLAEFSVFSIIWLLVAVVTYSLVLWGLSRPSKNALGLSLLPRPQFGLELFGLIGAVILAAALFVQPFEYIIGGLDSGVYVNTGINLAETGSIVIRDRTVAELTPSEMEVFFAPGAVLPGFTIADLGSGVVQPHGFHLFPVWIAILYSLGGVKAGLLATPLFGLLGVLGLYFLGKRLFGVQVGLLAAFLLSISIGQIWFSRFPVSEVLVQFLLLTGFFLFALTIDNRSRFFAFLAGISLGMAHMAKLELVLLPPAIIGFLVLSWAARKFRHEYWYLLAGYSIILAHAILHAVFVASNYSFVHVNDVWLPMINSFVPGSTGLFSKLLQHQSLEVNDVIGSAKLAAGTILIVAICWLATRFAVSRGLEYRGVGKEIAGLALFGLVTALAAYAWFVRPYYPSVDINLPEMAAAAQVNNRSSLIRLGWYISPIAVLLGLAGFVKAAIDEVNSKSLFFAVVAVPTSVLLLYNSFITPLHFWAGRRFVYIVIPAFILFAAYALFSLKRSRGIDWKANAIPASLAIALVLTLLRPAAPFLTHVDYAGATAQLAELSSTFPENSVTLFEYSLESHMFSTPLKYLYKKDVRMLAKGVESDPRLHNIIKRWLDQRVRVFLVTPANDSKSLPQGLKLSDAQTKPISLPEAPSARDSLPGKPHQFKTTLEIYEVVSVNSD